jgi:hypothetical protein
VRILSGTILIAIIFVIAPLAGVTAAQNKSSSIVIHDMTSPGNGGEGATQNLRNEIGGALEREKPCVETINDQDIRDAVQDERERELLEGGDPNEALRNLGNRMNSSLVMSVQAIVGPGGSVVYTVFVMDTTTAKTLARDTGTDAKQIADKMVRSLGPYLADNCQPHWTGAIRYVSSFNESKQKSDAGAMRAASRNTKRTLTETSSMQTTIKATLLASVSGRTASVNSTSARVSQRVKFEYQKSSKTTGELLCREPGKNPYFKGFSEDYSEITTQLGQGTDTMPVFISIDDDGSYSINVNAPAGVLLGKVETNRSASGCGSEQPAPTNDAQSLPEGKLDATSFEATGKTDPSKRDVLSGAQTSPDGRTKITWQLRLVKPKGKS